MCVCAVSLFLYALVCESEYIDGRMRRARSLFRSINTLYMDANVKKNDQTKYLPLVYPHTKRQAQYNQRNVRAERAAYKV